MIIIHADNSSHQANIGILLVNIINLKFSAIIISYVDPKNMLLIQQYHYHFVLLYFVTLQCN